MSGYNNMSMNFKFFSFQGEEERIATSPFQILDSQVENHQTKYPTLFLTILSGIYEERHAKYAMISKTRAWSERQLAVLHLSSIAKHIKRKQRTMHTKHSKKRIARKAKVFFDIYKQYKDPEMSLHTAATEDCNFVIGGKKWSEILKDHKIPVSDWCDFCILFQDWNDYCNQSKYIFVSRKKNCEFIYPTPIMLHDNLYCFQGKKEEIMSRKSKQRTRKSVKVFEELFDQNNDDIKMSFKDFWNKHHSTLVGGVQWKTILISSGMNEKDWKQFQYNYQKYDSQPAPDPRSQSARSNKSPSTLKIIELEQARRARKRFEKSAAAPVKPVVTNRAIKRAEAKVIQEKAIISENLRLQPPIKEEKQKFVDKRPQSQIKGPVPIKKTHKGGSNYIEFDADIIEFDPHTCELSYLVSQIRKFEEYRTYNLTKLRALGLSKKEIDKTLFSLNEVREMREFHFQGPGPAFGTTSKTKYLKISNEALFFRPDSEGAYMLESILDSDALPFLNLLIQLYETPTWTGWMSCVLQYLLVFKHKNDVQVSDIICMINSELHALREFLHPDCDFDFQSEELDPIQTHIRDIRLNFGNLRNIVDHKSFDLLLLIITYVFIKPLGLDENLHEKPKHYKNIIKAIRFRLTKHSEWDLITVASEASLAILDKAYNFVCYGKWDNSGSQLSTTYDDYLWLTQNEYNIKQSFIVDNTMVDPLEYDHKLQDCIERHKILIKNYPDFYPIPRADLIKNRNTLMAIQMKHLIAKRTSAMRDVPYSILLVGGSSIGKSFLTHSVIKVFHAVTHPTVKIVDDMIYYRGTSEFWDNYLGQGTIVFDDFDCFRTEVVNKPRQADVIDVINQASFIPPAAALENKGLYACRPELVIATSNRKEFGASQVFTYSSAALRRFPIVVNISIKPEYAHLDDNEEPGSIDQTKIPRDQGPVDIHDFVIERIVALSENRVQRNVIYRCSTMKEFRTFLGKSVREYMEAIIQTHKVASIFEEPMCPCGNLASDCDGETEFCKKYEMQGNVPTKEKTRQEKIEELENLFSSDPPPGWTYKPEPVTMMEKYDNFMQATRQLFDYNNFETPTFIHEYFNKIKVVHWKSRMQQTVSFGFLQSYASRLENWWSDFVFGYLGVIAFALMSIFPIVASVPFVGTLASVILYPPLTIFMWSMCACAYHPLKILNKITNTISDCVFFGTNKVLAKVYDKHKKEMFKKFAITSSVLVGLVIAKVSVSKIIAIIRGKDMKATTQGQVSPTSMQERHTPWTNFKNEHIDRVSIANDSPIRTTKLIDLVAICKKRTWKIEVNDSLNAENPNRAFAIDLGNHTFAANYHVVFPTKKHGQYVKFVDERFPANKTNYIITDPSNCYVFPEEDLVLFINKNNDATKSLRQYLLSGIMRGHYMTTNVLFPDKPYPTEMFDKETHKSLPVKYVRMGSGPFETVRGHCGTPIIVDGPSTINYLFGIHALLFDKSKQMGSIPLTLEHLDTFEKHVNKFFSTDVGEPNFQSISVTEDNKYCPLYWQSNAFVNYLGGDPLFRRSTLKSKVKRTDFYDTVPSYLCDHECTQPIFKGTRNSETGEWLGAFQHNFVERVQHRDYFEDHILIKCREEYIEPLLNVPQFSELGILSLDDALNGIDGVEFLDSIPKTTSAGYPYNKSKKYYLVPSGIGERIEWDDFMQSEYDEAFRLLSQGQRLHTIFKACLKDEARDCEKVRQRKIRVFLCANMIFSVLVRQYYLPICKLLHSNMLKSEMGPGLNCQGSEWHTLGMWLSEGNINKKTINGDFKNFDCGMSAQIMSHAFEVLLDIAKKSGAYTDSELRIMLMLAQEIIYPKVAFDGSIFQFSGSNPSGHPLTVIINSIVNSLYMRYTWMKVGNNINEFRHKVKLFTYGDDNIATVSDSIITTWNHNVIADLLLDKGVIYTSADKKSNPPPCISFSEASFLKRTFKMYEGRFMAPLELKSISKGLSFYRPNEVLGKEEHHSMLLTNFEREMFQHGRKEFERCHEIIWCLIRQLGEHYEKFFEFKSYDQYLLEYFNYPDFLSPKETIDFPAKTNHIDGPELILHNEGEREMTLCPTAPSCNEELAMTDLHNNNPALIMLNAEVLNKGIYKNYFLTESYSFQSSMPGEVNTGANDVSISQNEPDIAANGEGTVEGIAQDQDFIDFNSDLVGMSVSLPGRLQREPYTFSDAELSNFFSRPRKIAEYEWEIGTSFQQVVNTWEYFQHITVQRKLANYQLLSADMRVQIVISGSPFHYGCIMMGALPYPKYTHNSHNPFIATPAAMKLNKLSQLPHVNTFVGENQPSLLELPFIHRDNYINLATGDYDQMWRVYLYSTHPLQRANVSASEHVSVSIFMWADNVQLCAPTSYVFQGSREITTSQVQGKEKGGTYSGIAASASGLFATLKKVPLIGPYAATGKVLSDAAYAVLSHFGFARPVVDPEPMFVMRRAINNLSNIIGSESIQKLSLDPSQAVAYDSSIVGTTSIDELSFERIRGVETLIGVLTWGGADNPEDRLGALGISPMQCTEWNDMGLEYTQLSSIAFLAAPFKKWTGSIKVRIEIVKSKYHSGKMRVHYEPYTAGYTTDYNTTYSQIIDVAEQDDIEFTIPWSQAEPWLDTGLLVPHFAKYTNAPHYDPLTCNGKIWFSVLNRLNSPDATQPISMNVYVSAGPDFRCQVPTSEDISKFEFQSSRGNGRAVVEKMFFGRVLTEEEMQQREEMYFGETFNSFRSLIRRYGQIDSVVYTSGLAGLITMLFPLYPQPAGVDIKATTDARFDGTLVKANIRSVTFLEYVMNAYCFVRGGMRYKFVNQKVNSSEVADFHIVSKSSLDYNLWKVNTIYEPFDETDTGFDINQTIYGALFDGAIAGSPLVSPVLEFELPYYNHKRFSPAGSKNYYNGDSIQGASYAYQILSSGNQSVIDRFVAPADDFSTYGYVGPAIMQKKRLYTPPEPPVP